MHNHKLQNHHLQQHLLISTDSLPDSLSKKACSSLRCGRLRFRYVQLAKDIVLAVMKFKLTYYIYWSNCCWKQFRPIKPLKSVLRYICSNIKGKTDGLYFWGVALIRLILLSVTRMGISEYLLLGRRLILTFINTPFTCRTDKRCSYYHSKSSDQDQHKAAWIRLIFPGSVLMTLNTTNKECVCIVGV